MSLVEKQDPDLHDLPKSWPKVLLQSDMFQVELRDVLYKPQSRVEMSTEILDLLDFFGLPGHYTTLCAEMLPTVCPYLSMGKSQKAQQNISHFRKLGRCQKNKNRNNIKTKRIWARSIDSSAWPAARWKMVFPRRPLSLQLPARNNLWISWQNMCSKTNSILVSEKHGLLGRDRNMKKHDPPSLFLHPWREGDAKSQTPSGQQKQWV